MAGTDVKANSDSDARFSVKVPSALASRCRAIAGKLPATTVTAVAARAMALGLDAIEREVIESARRIVEATEAKP